MSHSHKKRRVSYGLLDCSFNGHVLVGTDAAHVRTEDELFARELGGLRWYRCIRCDSWIPHALPASPTRDHPPARSEIEVPLRGEVLRDRYILRLIAIERVVHFVVLGVLAIAVFVFAAHKALLQKDFVRIVVDLQGGVGGPVAPANGGVERELTRLFAISTRNLVITGVALAVYAALEGVESIGLWKAKRWAEYLTFISTLVFVPLEVYEIAHKPSALKAITLVINLSIVAYLTFAKRLFGIRGGGKAEHQRVQEETGWEAIELATVELKT
jgi:uncharacterized membrane protein (DUF2068 family)